MAAPPFMDTPLVVWVQTFRPDKVVTYDELFDGVYLNHVLKEIDSKCTVECVNTVVEDVRDRVQNWDVLMKNIIAYYTEVLQQMIVMKLPSIVLISKQSESDEARQEMTSVLLLILGCAVQSESRQYVIENIKCLEVDVQHAIMEYIKEITDETKNVFSLEVPLADMDEMSCSMFSHLNMLVQERNGYVEEIKELTQTLEEMYQTQQAAQQELATHKAALRPSTPSSSNSNLSNTPEKHHIAVELAETKAKLRKLRQELEDKTELAAELQEELDELKIVSTKLRSENVELAQDARAARTYRDEVDILKEKANRVDKYVLEINRYKDKLNEMDFFKARVEELREDNQVLVEAKLMLEEQLESSHKRIEAVINMEDTLNKYKGQVEQLVQDRDTDNQKMQILLERNAQLEFEKKSSFNENATLEEELVKARRQLNVGMSTSLNEQFSNSSNSRILRLEMEKQKLQQQLDSLQETNALTNNTKLLQLQQENLRLSEKINQLQAASTQEVTVALELEEKSRSLSRENQELHETMETIQQMGERQVLELQRENSHLQETLATLRSRNEQTDDLRFKDIERENRRLHDTVNEINSKLSQENTVKFQLMKKCAQLEDNEHLVKTYESDRNKLEHENDHLLKQVATLQLTCDKYDKLEQEVVEMRIEKNKLTKTVENLKASVAKLKALEQDNINLTVDAQSLQRTIKSMKNSSSQLVDNEQEKHELNEKICELTRTLETYKCEQAKQEQLEADLYEMDTENQKLQRSLESFSRKLEISQKENAELEVKNASLQKDIDNVKLSKKQMDELKKENQDLELENSQLQKSKDNIDKENKRLKQSLEKRDVQIDELNVKVGTLGRENKNLLRLAGNVDDLTERLQEAEQENMELVRQSTMDKKALTALREDLVSEKLKCQQLTNDLDKVNSELNRFGLNKERLIAAEHAEDESKFKALESILDDTFKRTLQIKEEKIHGLECRLQESMSRNQELQEDMKSLRQQKEALYQRREEEKHVLSRAMNRGSEERNLSISNTKDIMELKDDIIQVERKNARLEAECQSHQSRCTHLQEQLQRTESHLTSVQAQISTFQTQSSNQQSQLAKHQVDNRTLQSQNASLMSQNSSLQKECSRLESEKERLHSNYEDLNSKHDDLLVDHATLERLHEQVTREYEELISEHGSLKANFKALKQAYDEIVDQNAAMCRERETIVQLKKVMEEGQMNMKSDNASLAHLRMEYVKLKEENVTLQNDRGRIERKHEALLSDHKTLKQDYNNLRVRLSDLQREDGECKDQLNSMDVELNKLLNKCESMNQMNIRLEEDNRALMMQLQALLTQNQELLVASLESKDHFHEEEKSYLEKMSELKRQKEKLEEKIMEQYKRYDPEKKKNRSFGANLMRKARMMVSRNKSRERSKTPGEHSLAHDSVENSSLGSGSLGDDHVDRGRARHGRYRRGSSNTLREQNKNLAKSTTALSLLDSPTRSMLTLRGAKSNENLAAEDVDSMSSGNAEWSTRPSRRRALMADSSSLNLNNSGDNRTGSLSSEDTRSLQGSGHDASPKKDMSVRHDEEDDEEDDDDGLITLSDFLKEVDKSPKSRRKYIKQQKSEDPEKVSDQQTSILSPMLGPRSPLIEKDDKVSPSKIKSRNWKSEMNISQLSRITSIGTSDRHHAHPYNGSIPEMSTPHKRDIRSQDQVTSTPMPANPRASDNRENQFSSPDKGQHRFQSEHQNLNKQSPQMAGQRLFSNTLPYDSRPGELGARFNGGQMLPDGVRRLSQPNHSPSGGGPRGMPCRSVSSLGIPVNFAQDPAPVIRERSHTPSMGRQNSASSIGSTNIGAYNAMTRQTSASMMHDSPNQSGNRSLPRPPGNTSVNLNLANDTPLRSNHSEYLGNDVSRQDEFQHDRMQRSNSANTMHSANAGHRQDSSGHSSGFRDRSSQIPPSRSLSTTSSFSQNNNKYSDQAYIPGSGQRQLPKPPGQESGYPPPIRPLHNSASLNGHSEDYSPENVRNLVQNYQQIVNSEEPVPPPRQGRPMSAGPARPGSAFSVPTRSMTPGLEYRQPAPHSMPRPHSAHPDSAGQRALPQPPYSPPNSQTLNSHRNSLPSDKVRPTESGLTDSTANLRGEAEGHSPPKPGSGPPTKPKNPVWYEYGCV